MVLGWTEITDLAIATLSSQEKERVTIYLDERVVPCGTSLVIDKNQSISRPYNLAVGFVDLEPMVNWSHPCRYLLINVDNGAIEVVQAQFPPFFYNVPETLRLVWQGVRVPEWTIAVVPKDEMSSDS